MPIYMDVHNVPGVAAKDVADAHYKDLLIQHEFDCKCMTYWIDEEREKVFCLIDAPDKDVVAALHSRSHGLVPGKIIEVDSDVVASFLGRIYDPKDAAEIDGLKVFNDPSFRILLVTQTTDPVLLQYKYGKQITHEMLTVQNEIVRKNLSLYNGSNVEHAGNGFIISFGSACKAVSCALAIEKEMPVDTAVNTRFRIGIHAGLPVAKTDQLFGDAIHMARYLCAVNSDRCITISTVVKELIAREHVQNSHQFQTLSPADEIFLEQLYNKLEASWQDPDFNVSDYCQAMATSQSQLYRKTMAITGLSPNILVKEYRLEKAKELMKKQHYNVSQITFESGFTSPSYFTKCFKKKYGLLPMAYLELLQ